MDNGIDGVFGKESPGLLLVAEVHYLQREVFPSRNLLYAFKAGTVAVGEIVGHNYVIACRQQFNRYMTSDKTGAAGYQYRLIHCFPY
jgi:hypothetical protein